MFYTETVDNATLELIVKLQSTDYLKGFFLVEGTALSLQFGHRKSVDIDLFSNFNFDAQQILEQISYDFQFKVFYTAANTLKGSINNIQVDILSHRDQYIAEQGITDRISMLSLQDISAMKLNAIATSGQRVKDFIDVYYLLDKFNINDIVGFYKRKYSQENDLNILKSLIYFEDVDLSDWPVMIKEPKLKWSIVKKRIIKVVADYIEGKKVIE